MGNPVSATASHAMAMMAARSSGGKSRLLTAPGTILDAEIARSPAPPPALHLPSGQVHDFGGVVMADAGPFVKQKHEPETLNILNRRGAPSNRVHGLLQKSLGKDTRHRSGSTH
jgi:hypothetical protein